MGLGSAGIFSSPGLYYEDLLLSKSRVARMTATGESHQTVITAVELAAPAAGTLISNTSSVMAIAITASLKNTIHSRPGFSWDVGFDLPGML